MSYTDINREIYISGNLVIPKGLRRSLKSNIKDPIEIFTAEDAIIFRKYKANMTCMVTGDVSTQNVSFSDGKIIVSPKGAELLVKELDKFIVSEK